jgi:hypothetical protein
MRREVSYCNHLSFFFFSFVFFTQDTAEQSNLLSNILVVMESPSPCLVTTTALNSGSTYKISYDNAARRRELKYRDLALIAPSSSFL